MCDLRCSWVILCAWFSNKHLIWVPCSILAIYWSRSHERIINWIIWNLYRKFLCFIIFICRLDILRAVTKDLQVLIVGPMLFYSFPFLGWLVPFSKQRLQKVGHLHLVWEEGCQAEQREAGQSWSGNWGWRYAMTNVFCDNGVSYAL